LHSIKKNEKKKDWVVCRYGESLKEKKWKEKIIRNTILAGKEDLGKERRMVQGEKPVEDCVVWGKKAIVTTMAHHKGGKKGVKWEKEI